MKVPSEAQRHQKLPSELVRALQEGNLSQLRKAIAVVWYLGPLSYDRLYPILEPYGVAADSTNPKDRIRSALWGEEKGKGRFVKDEGGVYRFPNADSLEWFRGILQAKKYDPDKGRVAVPLD